MTRYSFMTMIIIIIIMIIDICYSALSTYNVQKCFDMYRCISTREIDYLCLDMDISALTCILF